MLQTLNFLKNSFYMYEIFNYYLITNTFLDFKLKLLDQFYKQPSR